MAELETFDLRLDACVADARRHFAQDVRRRQEGAIAEIERAAVERANFGPQFLDMGDALGGARHVGSRPAAIGMRGVEEEIPAHARGKIDDDVDARLPDVADGFAVERRVARGLAGVGIAHVQMDDRRAGARRFQRRIRRSRAG